MRVSHSDFPGGVAVLRNQYDVAQPENWTPTYTSFDSDRYALPLGIQVTVVGSTDDFLLALRDKMRSDHDLLRTYDERKVRAAPHGPTAYWEAKNDFLQRLLPAREREAGDGR